MRNLLIATVAAIALAAAVPAQQPNSAAGSMVINGVGAAPAPGPFFINASGGTTNTITMSGPAATPFVIVNANPALGGVTAAGTLATPFGIVDIGPIAFPPLEVVADGIGTTGVASWIFRTGASGSSTYPITLPAGGCPTDWANLQAIFPDPATVYSLTAAHKLYSGPDMAPVVVPTSDDSSTPYALLCGSSFTFYGVPYPTIYVNSNGNLTLGGAFTTYTESQTTFNTGVAKICHLWDDLYPYPAGGVTKLDDGVTFTATWTAVPEYTSTGANTVSVSLTLPTGDISITYGACSLLDCIVGITPGGGLATPVTIFAPTSPIGRISDRLTGGALGPYTGGAMESLNEVFVSGATAFNLAGATVSFTPANPGITSYTLY